MLSLLRALLSFLRSLLFSFSFLRSFLFSFLRTFIFSFLRHLHDLFIRFMQFFSAVCILGLLLLTIKVAFAHLLFRTCFLAFAFSLFSFSFIRHFEFYLFHFLPLWSVYFKVFFSRKTDSMFLLYQILFSIVTGAIMTIITLLYGKYRFRWQRFRFVSSNLHQSRDW